MNGTTNSAKRAMRLTPPKMMKPSATATTSALTQVGTPQAVFMPWAMLLACTPGSSSPEAITMTMAKIQAYHFWPIAFSM